MGQSCAQRYPRTRRCVDPPRERAHEARGWDQRQRHPGLAIKRRRIPEATDNHEAMATIEKLARLEFILQSERCERQVKKEAELQATA